MRTFWAVTSLIFLAWLCAGCGESEAKKRAKVQQAIQEIRQSPDKVTEIADEFKLKDYADQTLEPAKEMLKEKDKNIQIAAIKLLGIIRKVGAVPELLAFTTHYDPHLRAQAARALGSIGGADAVRALIELSDDEDLSVRATALESMGSVGDKQVLPYLTSALDSEHEALREAAVKGLVGLGALALQATLEVVEDGSDVAKKSAHKALDGLREKFRAELGNSDRLVRRDMARYIGRLRYRKAIDDLLKRLTEDTDPEVKAAAAYALGEMKARRAKKELRERMEDEKEESVVRLACAVALGKMGEKDALKFLISQLDSDEEIPRVRAASALGEIGKPAVPALLEALRSKKKLLRWGAAKALGDIGSRKATRALLKALRDRDEDVRVMAAAALGQIADPAALEGLKKALKDKSVRVRWHAAQALERIANSNSTFKAVWIGR